MKIFTTGFKELILIELDCFQDKRGFFYESWRDLDYRAIGIREKFVQDNVSISKKNVLRGLHTQKSQGQLVTLVYGRVFDVAVDIRPDSETYTKYFSIELSTDVPKQLYIPPGFAHGFCVLSDFAIMNYKCTQYYDPKKESGIIWNDPTININWPNLDFVISSKDKNFIPL